MTTKFTIGTRMKDTAHGFAQGKQEERTRILQMIDSPIFRDWKTSEINEQCDVDSLMVYVGEVYEKLEKLKAKINSEENK